MAVIGPLASYGASKVAQKLLPPEIYPDEEKEKSHIINTNLLTQGQTEYQLDRAQKMYKGMMVQEGPTTLSNAMHQTGAELQDATIEKDAAWWEKSLGFIGKYTEPLKYLEIPAELLAETVEGVIPGKWSGEGTAERTDFEAWSALFGRDKGSFKERIDLAAEAFEKRPLWAQLGLGVVQVGATFGTSAWLKGAQYAGKGVRMATAARAGAMVLDPWEVGFMGVRGAYRGSKTALGKGTKSSIAPDGSSLHLADENVSEETRKLWEERGIVGGGSPEAGSLDDTAFWRSLEPEEWAGIAEPEKARYNARIFWDSDDVARYDLGTDGQILSSREGGYIHADVVSKQLPDMAQRGNTIRNAVKSFYSEWSNATVGSSERVMAARKLLTFQLGTSVGSREGHTFGVKAGNIFNSDTSLIKSNRIDHIDIKTGQSMVLRPLDNGEAQVAAELYRQSLEEWTKANRNLVEEITGIKIADDAVGEDALKWIGDNDQILTVDLSATKGQRFFKNNEEVFSGTKAPDTTFNSILKEVKDADPERWELLPESGRLFRQQRATEMALEGRAYEDIARQLNHASTAATTGYLRGIPFIGDKSRFMEDSRSTARMVDAIGSEGSDEWVQQALDATKGAPTRRTKGMEKGAVNYDRMAMEVGHAATITDIGKEHIAKYIPPVWKEHWARVIEEGSTGTDFIPGSPADNARKLASSGLRLFGVIRKADAVERTRSFAEHTKKAINHNYGNAPNRRRLYQNDFRAVSDKPGLINRAGYFLNENGAIEWGGSTVKSKAHWTKQRETLRKQAAMPDSVYGLGAENAEQAWLNWAVTNFDQIKHADEIIENTKLKGIQGQPVRFKLDEVLREFADIEAWRLGHLWSQLPRDIREDLGFDDLFRQLLDHPISKTGLGGSSSYWNSGSGAYKAVWNDLNRKVVNNQTFNKFWQKTRNVVVPGEEAPKRMYMRLSEQDMANQFRDSVPLLEFSRWLDDTDVASAFGLARLSGKTHPKDILEKVMNMAKRSPRLFGDDFSAFQKANPAQANKWIEVLANRIGNHRELWVKIAAITDPEEQVDELERLIALRPGRGRARYAEGLIEGTAGMSASEISGVLPHVHYTANRIKTLTNVFGKNFQSWINEDKLYKQKLKTFVINPIFTVVAGGKAGIAPLITRGISTRAHLFPFAEQSGEITSSVFRDVGKGLELSADEATPAMLKVGLKQGQQYFKKLDSLLRDNEDILKWELTDESKNANIRYAPKDSATKNGGVWHRLDAAMRSDDAKMRKYMTQVDIVLERVRPEHWHNYFEGVAIDGANADVYNKLLYMRDVIWQTDQLARTRGLDLVKIIDDKGVEYLDDYFPRMYQFLSKGLRITKDANGMLTDGAEGYFKNRKIDDIVNILGRSEGTVRDIVPHEFILEDIGIRAGKYVESIQKKIIDFETVKWLKETPEYIEGAALRTEVKEQNSALNALARLVNQQFKGEVAELNTDSFNRVKAYWGEGKGQALAINGWNMEMFEETAETISQKTRDKIINQIAETKEQIVGNWLNKVGAEKGGDGADWLKSTLSVLGLREQRAIQEYMQVTTRNYAQGALKGTGKAAAPVSGLLRYFKSAIDIGAPMIHGFNALVRAPLNNQGRLDWTTQKAWFKGVREMGKFWWEPERYEQFKLERLADINEARQYVRMSTPEPLMAKDDKALQAVRSWASKKLPKHKHAKFLSRFESSFAGFLDILRTEIWTSMKVSVDNELGDMAKAAAKAGQTFDSVGMRNDRYHDLGAVINKMTGAFDPHLAQQTPFQTLVENSLLFFAPMYRRATFGILGDIFRYRESGGIRSKQALTQLGGVITIGASMAMLAEMTGNNTRAFLFDEEGELGEEGELDITARFGKFNAHGMQMGIGTAWWTAMRVASDIAMHFAHQDDDGEIDLSEDSHWSDHWFFTFMQRRGRSQLAPATGLFTDLVSGRTFIGEPLRDGDENNWQAMGQHAGKYAVPFWLDSAFSGNSWQGSGIGMATEFLGLQSYPISSYDKLVAAREDAINTTTIPAIVEWRKGKIAEGKNPNYIGMPRALRNVLNEETTNVRLLMAEHEEKYGRIATGNAKDLRLFMQEMNNFNLQGVKDLAIVARQFERGEVDFSAVNNILKNVKYAKSNHSRSLMEKYPAMATYFAELRAGRDDSDIVFQGDVLYDKWQGVRNDPTHRDSMTGVWNYRKQEVAEDAFWNDPQAMKHKEYIINRHDQWMRVLPTIKAFEEAKDDLSDAGYFSVQDSLWAPGSAMHVSAVKYIEWNEIEQNQMRKRDPKYRHIARMLKQKRQQIQASSSVLDDHLVRYYGNAVRHPANRGLKDRLLQERMPGNEVTANYDRFIVSPTGQITIQ